MGGPFPWSFRKSSAFYEVFPRARCPLGTEPSLSGLHRLACSSRTVPGRGLLEAGAQGFTAPTTLGVDQSWQLARPGGRLRAATDPIVSDDNRTAEILARQHQLTLNTLVQGAWALLLNRYSGEDDVVFGVTVSGRPAL